MNINFRAVTRLDSITNLKNSSSCLPVRLDAQTSAVLDILNCRPAQLYTQEQAQAIRNYHQSYIKDYDGKTAIVCKINDELYLITGKEAKEIKDTHRIDYASIISKGLQNPQVAYWGDGNAKLNSFFFANK